MLKSGRINPLAQLAVVRDSPAVIVADACNGLGLVTSVQANRIAMSRAEANGAAWVSVFNSNHFGIAGYYVAQSVASGLIGLAMTNTPALVSPLWGSGRMLGTNPIAAGFPAGEEPPVIIDMATSGVSFGVVESSRRYGWLLPDGCVADAHGRPTTDPADFFAGRIAPTARRQPLQRAGIRGIVSARLWIYYAAYFPEQAGGLSCLRSP